jgi:ADP-ribose pyrophosphatase
MTPGESETESAQRELAEEAGYRAGRLEKLCTFDSSKSVLEETVHLYLATDLVAVHHEPDETEFIEVQTFPFHEVLGMVLRSEIVDAMTVVAVLHAARARR